MKVSVALATYNGAKYLPEQLDSLRAQTLLPFELLVGDDGSTDDTLAILERFARTAPFPVSVVRNNPSLGCGLNFFDIARRCSGDWIAFCDQDDVWSPNKLIRCEAIVERGPVDLQLIIHNATVTDEQLVATGPLSSGPFGTFGPGMLPHSYIAHGFREVFKRDLVDLIPKVPRLGWLGDPHSHDVWVSVVASLAGSVEIIADRLALYRRHGATVTAIAHTSFEQATEQRFRNNGQVYKTDAKAFDAFARDLRDAAPPPLLSRSVTLVECYAAMLEQRAAIYLSSRRVDRARALLRLLRMRAYGTKHAWQFHPRSLAKDVVQIVLGP